jgi:hypothetical protein
MGKNSALFHDDELHIYVYSNIIRKKNKGKNRSKKVELMFDERCKEEVKFFFR